MSSIHRRGQKSKRASDDIDQLDLEWHDDDGSPTVLSTPPPPPPPPSKEKTKKRESMYRTKEQKEEEQKARKKFKTLTGSSFSRTVDPVLIGVVHHDDSTNGKYLIRPATLSKQIKVKAKKTQLEKIKQSVIKERNRAFSFDSAIWIDMEELNIIHSYDTLDELRNDDRFIIQLSEVNGMDYQLVYQDNVSDKNKKKKTQKIKNVKRIELEARVKEAEKAATELMTSLLPCSEFNIEQELDTYIEDVHSSLSSLSGQKSYKSEEEQLNAYKEQVLWYTKAINTCLLANQLGKFTTSLTPPSKENKQRGSTLYRLFRYISERIVRPSTFQPEGRRIGAFIGKVHNFFLLWEHKIKLGNFQLDRNVGFDGIPLPPSHDHSKGEWYYNQPKHIIKELKKLENDPSAQTQIILSGSKITKKVRTLILLSKMLEEEEKERKRDAEDQARIDQSIKESHKQSKEVGVRSITIVHSKDCLVFHGEAAPGVWCMCDHQKIDLTDWSREDDEEEKHTLVQASHPLGLQRDEPPNPLSHTSDESYLRAMAELNHIRNQKYSNTLPVIPNAHLLNHAQKLISDFDEKMKKSEDANGDDDEPENGDEVTYEATETGEDLNADETIDGGGGVNPDTHPDDYDYRDADDDDNDDHDRRWCAERLHRVRRQTLQLLSVQTCMLDKQRKQKQKASLSTIDRSYLDETEEGEDYDDDDHWTKKFQTDKKKKRTKQVVIDYAFTRTLNGFHPFDDLLISALRLYPGGHLNRKKCQEALEKKCYDECDGNLFDAERLFPHRWEKEEEERWSECMQHVLPFQWFLFENRFGQLGYFMERCVYFDLPKMTTGHLDVQKGIWIPPEPSFHKLARRDVLFGINFKKLHEMERVLEVAQLFLATYFVSSPASSAEFKFPSTQMGFVYNQFTKKGEVGIAKTKGVEKDKHRADFLYLIPALYWALYFVYGIRIPSFIVNSECELDPRIDMSVSKDNKKEDETEKTNSPEPDTGEELWRRNLVDFYRRVIKDKAVMSVLDAINAGRTFSAHPNKSVFESAGRYLQNSPFWKRHMDNRNEAEDQNQMFQSMFTYYWLTLIHRSEANRSYYQFFKQQVQHQQPLLEKSIHTLSESSYKVRQRLGENHYSKPVHLNAELEKKAEKLKEKKRQLESTIQEMDRKIAHTELVLRARQSISFDKDIRDHWYKLHPQLLTVCGFDQKKGKPYWNPHIATAVVIQFVFIQCGLSSQMTSQAFDIYSVLNPKEGAFDLELKFTLMPYTRPSASSNVKIRRPWDNSHLVKYLISDEQLARLPSSQKKIIPTSSTIEITENDKQYAMEMMAIRNQSLRCAVCKNIIKSKTWERSFDSKKHHTSSPLPPHLVSNPSPSSFACEFCISKQLAERTQSDLLSDKDKRKFGIVPSSSSSSSQ